MKSALFSGISAKKKNDDSSDDEKTKKKEEPVNEINLLDMDSGPPSGQQPAATGDLLDTGNTDQSNNLLDVMGGGAPSTQPDNSLPTQLDSMLNLNA